MSDVSRDSGAIQVLLKRLNEERLPHALKMKARVDAGGCLDDYDLRFLEQVFSDAGEARNLVDRHPEFSSLVARLASLYSEITRKALENEQGGA